MNGDEILRGKARDLIRAGHVPKRLPDRVWGGAAFGGYCCMLCGTPVAPNEIALEVAFSSGIGAEGTNAHFHSPCFLALEVEILNLSAGGQAIPCSDPEPSAAVSPGAD